MKGGSGGRGGKWVERGREVGIWNPPVHPLFLVSLSNDCICVTLSSSLQIKYIIPIDICVTEVELTNNAIYRYQLGAKIRNRYNQVPHLTPGTNGKVTNSVIHHKREPRGQPFLSRTPLEKLDPPPP